MKHTILFVSLIILSLIFHDTVFSGAQNGLLLWYQLLVPTLLPFILITNAFLETRAYLPIIGLFHPKNTSYLYGILSIIIGVLCGYPIGAKLLNDFVKNNHLSSNLANQLLAVSSQASPMFLIGYVYSHSLKNEMSLAAFLFCFYIPILLLSLYKLFKYNDFSSSSTIISNSNSITDTFTHAVEIIVQVGVYVIVFSILVELLTSWIHDPRIILFICPLEITNGISLLTKSSCDLSYKIPYLCSLCSFGGICSSYQIFSVSTHFTPNKKGYYLDKCILSFSTLLLIYLYLQIR